jgi:hypothetical protein
MDRAQIKERLKLPLLNVTLATVGKRDGDLTLACEALYDSVGELLKQAQREAMAGKR